MVRRYGFTLSLLGMVVATSALAQRGSSADGEDRTHARTVAAIDGLKKDLRDARRLLIDLNDRKLRDQLERLLDRAALRAEDLEELVARSSQPRSRQLISDADFAKLLKNLKERPFDDDKVEFVEAFIKDRPLNCEQATELLKMFSFDDGRTKAAICLYPGLVDAENFFEVLKVFSFDSNRKKVMEAVRKR